MYFSPFHRNLFLIAFWSLLPECFIYCVLTKLHSLLSLHGELVAIFNLSETILTRIHKMTIGNRGCILHQSSLHYNIYLSSRFGVNESFYFLLNAILKINVYLQKHPRQSSFNDLNTRKAVL